MLYSEVPCTHCLCCAKSLQSSLTLCNPMDYSPQVPLSLEFSRQGYWHGLPCPPPGDLPNSGIGPWSSALQVNSLLSEPPDLPQTLCIHIKSCMRNNSWSWGTQSLLRGRTHDKSLQNEVRCAMTEERARSLAWGGVRRLHRGSACWAAFLLVGIC